MAKLTVHVDERIVRALERRAERDGHTSEEAHREILRRVLESKSPVMPLKSLLSAMPNVGDDRDFERVS